MIKHVSMQANFLPEFFVNSKKIFKRL